MAEEPDLEPDIGQLKQHHEQVGLLCSQWAYLEWLLEIAFWWLLGLLNKPKEGRTITSGLSIDTLAGRVRDLAHMQIKNRDEIETLKRVASRIEKIKDDRNLAVHGVRSLQPDNTLLMAIARGKYKHKPEAMPLIRLNSINTEVAMIIAEIEPLLHDHDVIEGVTAISVRHRYPQR